jgi:hypothetical protein
MDSHCLFWCSIIVHNSNAISYNNLPSKKVHAVTVLTPKWDVPSSSSCWDTDYPGRYYVGFLSISSTLQRQYLKLGHNDFLPNPFPFIVHYHAVIRRYVDATTDSNVKLTTNKQTNKQTRLCSFRSRHIFVKQSNKQSFLIHEICTLSNTQLYRSSWLYEPQSTAMHDRAPAATSNSMRHTAHWLKSTNLFQSESSIYLLFVQCCFNPHAGFTLSSRH